MSGAASEVEDKGELADELECESIAVLSFALFLSSFAGFFVLADDFGDDLLDLVCLWCGHFYVRLMSSRNLVPLLD